MESGARRASDSSAEQVNQGFYGVKYLPHHIELSRSSVSPPKKPKKKEIAESTLLQSALSGLSLVKKEPNMKTFLVLLERIDAFLRSEENESLRFFYTPKFTKAVVGMMNGLDEVENVKMVLGVLEQAVGVSARGFDVDLTVEFFLKCLGCVPCLETEKLFSKLFQLSEFVEKIAKMNKFILIFTEVFSRAAPDVCDFVDRVIFDNAPDETFKSVNFPVFLASVIPFICSFSVKDGNERAAAVFVARLFQGVSRYTKDLSIHFTENDGFVTFDLLLATLAPPIRASCYKLLLNSYNDDLSKPPNLMVLFHLYRLFIHQKEMQKCIFDIVYESLKEYPECAHRMNRAISFSDWFGSTDVRLIDIARMIDMIDHADPSIVEVVLPFFFKKLTESSAETDDIECYDITLGVIERRGFSLVFLLDLNFLVYFVIQLPGDKLVRLLQKRPMFSQLIADVFGLDGAISYRQTVIKAILNLGDTCCDRPEYAELLSTLVSMSPTKEVMKDLLDSVMQNPGLLSCLERCFARSGEAGVVFVKIGGLEYVKSLEFSIQIELLACLISRCIVPEVDEYLGEIQKTLSKEMVEKLVYGNSNEKYRSIRCPSLLESLDVDFEALDPYNLYLIGKHLHITEPCVAKRYIDPESVDRILESDSRTLAKYLCQTNESFPFYQLFPTDSLSVSVKETGISCVSFWWRVSDKTDVWRVLFKTNGNLTVSCKEQKMRIDTSNHSYHFSVNPLKWNYVNISKSLMQVNECSVEAEHSGSAIRNFWFLGIPDSLVFIARACYSKQKIHNQYERSVKHLDQSVDVIFVTGLHDCYVENYGFGFHVLSPKRMERVLAVLKALKDGDEFKSLFALVFQLLQQSQYLPDFLWDPILELIEIRQDVIDTELLRSFIDLAIMNTDSSCEWHLRNIIFHPCMRVPCVMVELILKMRNDVKWRAVDQFSFLVYTTAIETRSCELISAIFLDQSESLVPARRLLLSTLQNSSDVELCRLIANVLHSCPVSAELVSFEELKNLLVCRPEIRLEIFDVMLKIESIRPSFIEIDHVIMFATLSLASFERLWDALLNCELWALLMMFVWAGATALIHAASYGLCVPKWVQEKVNQTNKILAAKMAEFISDKLYKDIVLYLFPFCVNYPKLFEEVAWIQSAQKPLNFGKISVMTFLRDDISQCFHYSADQLKQIQLPVPPVPPDGIKFLRDVLRDMFRSFGFDGGITGDFKMTELVALINEGPVIELFLRATLASDDSLFVEIVHTVIGAGVYTDRKHGRVFAFPFLHRLIHELESPSKMFQTLCIIHKTLSESFLRTNSIQLMSDVMNLLLGIKVDTDLFAASLKYADSVWYDLFLATPSHSLQFALAVFMDNPEIAKHVFDVGVDKWISAFALCLEFCPRMKRFVDMVFGLSSPVASSIMNGQTKTPEITRVPACTLKVLRPERVAKFYDNISHTITTIKFIHTCENTIFTELCKCDKAALEMRIRQACENYRWQSKLRHARTKLVYDKKLLNPFVLPYRVPSVTVPCPQMTVTELCCAEAAEIPMADLISRNVLPINAELLRYQHPIPCVCLCGDDAMTIVTNVKLEDGQMLFLSREYPPHFLCEVTAGLYGRTEMWFSHIAIVIEKKWTMKCMRLSHDVTQLWTFTNGTFVLKSDSCDAIFRIFPLGGISDPQNITEAIVAKNYSLGRTFCDFKNFPVFPISMAHSPINMLCGCLDNDEHFLPDNSLDRDTGVFSWYELNFHEAFLGHSRETDSFNQTLVNMDNPVTYTGSLTVSLDSMKRTLTITTDSSTLFVVRHDKLEYATAATGAGKFIAIDYKFGLTEVLTTVTGSPVVVSCFSVAVGQRAVLSDCEPLCGIAFGSKLDVYHVFTHALLSSRDFGQDIVGFDFHHNGIIVATSTSVYALDFNKNVITSESVHVTAIMALADTLFVIGTPNGRVSLMEIKNGHLSMRQTLPSRHRSQVCSIFKHKNGFITRDVDGVSWLWQQ